ncbi:MAG: N-formylglutamate amidohydrolase [Pseudomonadota bacterium]
MTRTVYSLRKPENHRACIVLNSAHSGRDYPEPMVAASNLSTTQLRSSEDAYVDELFGAAPGLGVPMLSANFPRAFVDVNRASDELDPALIQGISKRSMNPRVACGLGVIPRVVAEGREIRAGKMTLMAAKTRLSKYYWPYHRQLTHLLDETQKAFGSVLLLDCHSMPSQAGGADPIPYDIILGDRFGASCGGDLMDIAESFFADAGFNTGRNAPFAGAHLAQKYGSPLVGRHVIQIEVNRGLYLDEVTVAKSELFSDVQSRLTGVLAALIDHLSPKAAMAAE